MVKIKKNIQPEIQFKKGTS